MRPTAIVLVALVCLGATGCGKHSVVRYTAVPSPGSWSAEGDHFNAQGVRFAQLTEEGRTRWYFVHLDGSREPIANMPDAAVVTDINDGGMLTGFVPVAGCSGDHCPARAFLWTDGAFKDLGMPAAATAARPWAINNRGEIAGSYEVRSDHPAHCISEGPEHHAFRFSDGKFSELSGPAGFCGMVISLNDAGDTVVEFGRLNDGGQWQLIREVYGKDGVKVRVDGRDNYFYHINNADVIAGEVRKSDGYEAAALFYDGKPKLMDHSDNWRSEAKWINDDGIAVGFAYIGPAHGGIARAVKFEDGKAVDLNSLIDWSTADRDKHLIATLASSVNNQGDILCAVADTSGNRVGLYVLRPEGD